MKRFDIVFGAVISANTGWMSGLPGEAWQQHLRGASQCMTRSGAALFQMLNFDGEVASGGNSGLRLAVRLAGFLTRAAWSPSSSRARLQLIAQIPGRSGSAFNALPAPRIRVEHEA